MKVSCRYVSEKVSVRRPRFRSKLNDSNSISVVSLMTSEACRALLARIPGVRGLAKRSSTPPMLIVKKVLLVIVAM